MSVVVAYRCTSPSLLKAYRAYRAERTEYGQRCEALCEELVPGSRGLYRGAHLVGLDFPGDAPRGWRIQKYGGTGVPDMRLKAGKLAKEAMENLGNPPADIRYNLPGNMPGEVWDNTHFYHCGMGEWGGAIYVYWGIDPETVTTGFSWVGRKTDETHKISKRTWKRIKLSEFYAAKEAAQEAEAA